LAPAAAEKKEEDGDQDILQALKGLKEGKESFAETKQISAEHLPAMEDVTREMTIKPEELATRPAEQEDQDLRDALKALKKDQGAAPVEEPQPAPAQAEKMQTETQEIDMKAVLGEAAAGGSSPAAERPETAPSDADIADALKALREGQGAAAEQKPQAEQAEKIQAETQSIDMKAVLGEAKTEKPEPEVKEPAPSDADIADALKALKQEAPPAVEPAAPSSAEQGRQETRKAEITDAAAAPDQAGSPAAQETPEPSVPKQASEEPPPAGPAFTAAPAPAAAPSAEEPKKDEEDISEEDFQKLLKDSGIQAAPGEEKTPEEGKKEPTAPETLPEKNPEAPAPSAAEKKAPEEPAAAPAAAAAAATPVKVPEPGKEALESVTVEEITAEQAAQHQKPAEAPAASAGTAAASVEITEGAAKAEAKKEPSPAAKAEFFRLKRLLPYAAGLFAAMTAASAITLVIVLKSADTAKKAEAILGEGVKLVNEGRLAEGVEKLNGLEQYIQESNELLEKYIKAADAIYGAEASSPEAKAENCKEARKIYQKIISTFPKHGSVLPLYFKAADCAKQLGLTDEAAAYYDSVAEQFPESPLAVRAWYEKGVVLVELGEFDEARKLYLKLIREYPGSEYAGRAYFRLAESYSAEAEKMKKEMGNP
jgi:tetratricopeptide (TPR) repeat protein